MLLILCIYIGTMYSDANIFYIVTTFINENRKKLNSELIFVLHKYIIVHLFLLRILFPLT